MAIKLGSVVKDSLTGFSGIAVARTEYLWGCVSIAILSKKLNKETATPQDWVWLDEKRLETKSKTPGGDPVKAPQRN